MKIFLLKDQLNNYKTIIRNFKKGKVRWSFIDNIWGADFADVQIIRKFNKGIRSFIMCY